jgi:hypothetical protein
MHSPMTYAISATHTDELRRAAVSAQRAKREQDGTSRRLGFNLWLRGIAPARAGRAGRVSGRLAV